MKKLKLIGLGLLIMVTSIAFIGCKAKTITIDFVVALGPALNLGSTDLKKIVHTEDEWNVILDGLDLDVTYDNEFFKDNSLLVYAFGTPAKGYQMEVTNISKKGKEILVEIDVFWGYMDMISMGTFVIEVKKSDIKNANSLRIAYNEI